ncbi:MAG TPA: PAS domain S-box protein [Nitriliruptorales bacterium]|nr:PAS domain S-box protein [Nitriliruptorales bacterium]
MPAETGMSVVDDRREGVERRALDRRARFFDLALELQGICDDRGRYLQVNPAHERVLGWPAEELVGRHYLRFVHPDDRSRLATAGQQLVAGEIPRVWLELRVLCRNGSYRWLQTSATFVADDCRVYAVGMDITERKHEEERYRERQTFVDTLLDTLHEGIIACDADGRLTILNRAIAQLFGVAGDSLPPERWTELLGMRGPDGVTPLTTEEMPLYRALHGEVVRDQEVVLRPPGSDRPRRVLMSGQALHDVDGRKLGAVIAVHDVTERFRAERDMRRLAALVENSHDLVGIADLEGRLVFLNPAGARLVGVRGDPTGMPVRDFYTPGSWGRLRDEAIVELQRRGSWQGRGQLRHAVTGEPIDVDMTVFRIDDQRTGELACYATIQRDVTDQLRAERALQEVADRERALRRERRHAEQVQALTRASMLINSALSTEEILDQITRQAALLIGAHQSVTSLMMGGDGEQGVTSVHLSEKYADRQACDAPPIATRVYALVCRDDRPVRLTQRELERHPELGGGGPDASDHPPLRGLLAAPLIARDGTTLGLIQLSDRHEGEFTETDEALLVQLAQIASVAIEKAHLYELAAQQQTARFREELLAGISHDMQTPLASISGLSDLLHDVPDLPLEERIPIYDTLARQSRTLHGLVQQFLDYSRLEADRSLIMRLRPTDVVAAIDRVVEMFGHSREIIVGAALDLPKAQADPDRLDQVLTNLVSNGIKFSDAPVRVVARHRRDRVLIDVVDEGRGIPPEDLASLFGKFHRGSNVRATPGTGLGLYISRAVVEAMGGTLTVRSRLDVGTRFTVNLPVADRTARW